MAMTFADAVEGRRSVRRFASDPVPREDVREMISLATRAANAGNKQVWRFIAVDDRDLLRRMGETVAAKLDEIAAWPSLRDEAAKVRAHEGLLHVLRRGAGDRSSCSACRTSRSAMSCC